MCGKGDINTLKSVVFIITALINYLTKFAYSVYFIWIITRCGEEHVTKCVKSIQHRRNKTCLELEIVSTSEIVLKCNIS